MKKRKKIMFSLKHCHGFVEDLYPDVTGVRADLNHASEMYGVRFQSPPGIHHHLGHDLSRAMPSGVDGPAPEQPKKGERGAVYVVNEMGETVATYHL